LEEGFIAEQSSIGIKLMNGCSVLACHLERFSTELNF